LALLVYVAISLFWYRSVVAHMNTGCACGLGVDPGDGAVAVWWLEWFVHALSSGLPLMHPTVIWTPTGINMYSTTAALLLAVVSAPLTLLWGPIATFNVTMILAPAISAWGANRLCRYVTGSAPASLVGGMVYGFSTYEIGHMVGHVNIVIMVCPPLVALCVLRLLAGSISNRRFVIELSLLLVAQTFVSLEVLFTMTVVGFIALVAAWITGDPAQRHAIVRRVPVIALAYGITMLVSSWYVVQVFTTATHAQGVGGQYPTDVLSFLIPMPYTWLGGAHLQSISSKFPGGWDETTAYLGLPLMLIMGRYLITRRHTRPAQILAILTFLLVFWILGPILWVGGRPILRLPYQLLANLPVFSDVLEGRVTIYLALVAAVILAMWLASPRRLRATAWVCAMVALLSVLPNLVHPSANNVSTWTNPAFFRTAMYQRYLRRGETILPINWAWSGESFMWQAEDHMYWNMANGYWTFSPPPGWGSQLADDLWVNQKPHTGDARLLRNMIIKRHVSDVVVQDDSVGRWRHVLQEAGLRQSAQAGGITLYRVPRAWFTTGQADATA
jgi:hypothetical protein